MSQYEPKEAKRRRNYIGNNGMGTRFLLTSNKLYVEYASLTVGKIIESDFGKRTTVGCLSRSQIAK
jgi:hypothetical protein